MSGRMASPAVVRNRRSQPEIPSVKPQRPGDEVRTAVDAATKPAARLALALALA
jgi:hypothetical protein